MIRQIFVHPATFQGAVGRRRFSVADSRLQKCLSVILMAFRCRQKDIFAPGSFCLVKSFICLVPKQTETSPADLRGWAELFWGRRGGVV